MNDLDEAILLRNESYFYCKRLFRSCQSIVFAETNSDLSSPELLRTKISPIKALTAAHIPPTLVGMGLLLGSVASPIPFIQGEKMIMIESKQARYLQSLSSLNHMIDDEDLTLLEGGPPQKAVVQILQRVPKSSPTVEELSKGSAFSFKTFLKKIGGKSDDSIQLDDLNHSKSRSLDRGFKNIESRPSSANLTSTHYFHAEIQFIMSLIGISEKLVNVPKFARQPSLIAELTLLNHNLPANICIPFWCPSNSISQIHHQIVQIALSDCVVLNSAERVPFLACVEVIECGDNEFQSHRSSGASAPGKEVDFGFDLAKLEHRNSKEIPSDYFISIVSKRQPEIKPITKLPLQLRQSPTSSQNRVSTPTQEESSDEFSNRMRTAAIMLAQLYQEQQKGAILNNGKPHIRSETVQSAPPGINLDKSNVSLANLSSGSKESLVQNGFEEIRNRVLKEMSASEQQRIQRFTNREQDSFAEIGEALPEGEEEKIRNASSGYNNEDPSASVFREPWDIKKKRIRDNSTYGKHPKWNLYSVIIKSGTDLRQEQLALQLIAEIQKCWEAFEIPIWVYSFRVLITSVSSGLIEVIPDSVSVHSIKKEAYLKRVNQPGFAYTLYDHFVRVCEIINYRNLGIQMKSVF